MRIGSRVRTNRTMKKRKSRVKGPQLFQIGRRLYLIRRYTINQDTGKYWRQIPLADKFGVNQTTIKNYEKNRRRVDHERLFAYAALAHLSIDWILRGKIVTENDRRFVRKVAREIARERRERRITKALAKTR